MIEVKVSLISAVHPSRSRELMKMHITNDGTRGGGRGSYHAEVYRKGTNKILRNGQVENYPRHSYHVGRLVLRALKACFPEEK